MKKDTCLLNFVKAVNYSDFNIECLLDNLGVDEKSLIKTCFKFIKSLLLDFKNDDYTSSLIKNTVSLLKVLTDRVEFSKEEIEVNRIRIKKLRESLLSEMRKKDNPVLLDSANILDEIILDKSVDAKSLLKLIKILINKKEDIDVIKKILNVNKETISYNNSELFDFVFDKTMSSLEEKNFDVYYYITLLKLAYTSQINKDKYLKWLNNTCTIENIFSYEIYLIIYGLKRGLSCNEILEKYNLDGDFIIPSFILPKKASCADTIITIDGSKTEIRDDGLSVRKDGNNYIVGIHVADPARFIVKDGACDEQAKNNFKALYLNGCRTHILPTKTEKDLSLNKGKTSGVITLYVVMNDSGDLLDYYITKNNIVVSESLSYFESENILDCLVHSDFDKNLMDLLMLSSALEAKEENQDRYWTKKVRTKQQEKYSFTRSDIIVREFMVLYNRILATIAKDSGIPYIYRYQDREYISTLVDDLGISINDQTQHVVDGIYLEGKYSSTPRPHTGLNYDLYSHSGNPLRRYVDLYNQYLLHMFYFNDINFDFSDKSFEEFVEYCNQRSIELSLFKGEYNREARLIKKIK